MKSSREKLIFSITENAGKKKIIRQVPQTVIEFPRTERPSGFEVS